MPVRRILNGIDLTARPPRPISLAEEPRSLVFVGRLNAQKNAPLLIEALAGIQECPWRLTVVGDGPEMGEVRKRIGAQGLEGRVTLTGWRSVEEVAGILRASDVLCMPSSSEGMPVVGAEALKHGLAIAGSRIPGLKDVLTAGVNGVDAPPGDAREYGRAVATLLHDSELLLRMRQASWDRALDFDLARIASAYEEVLEQAIGTSSPKGPANH
jgi:glycosyltransferase involved in cell wall biosynthesis